VSVETSSDSEKVERRSGERAILTFMNFALPVPSYIGLKPASIIILLPPSFTPNLTIVTHFTIIYEILK